jgi:hypothetical protein
MQRDAFMLCLKHVTIAVATALSACGGAPSSESGSSGTATFPLDAYASITSDQGAYRIGIRTSPTQPPAPGVLRVQLAVTTADAQPADALRLEVEPWMPSDGHGAPMTPTVIAKGGGLYELDNVDLYMPGRWALLMTLRADNASDYATTLIDVE